MTARKYVDNAPTATLTASITNSDTVFTVSSLSGFPTSFPYTASLDLGTSSAEVVLVTGASGPTVTVTRNYNGGGAFAHTGTSGTFTHVATAQDLQEANDHINATTGVHGLAAGVAPVGVTSTQTLTNKTLTSPAISNPTFSGTTNALVATGNLQGGVVTATSGDVSSTAGNVTAPLGGFISPGYKAQLAWPTTTQALTNSVYTKLTSATSRYDSLNGNGGGLSIDATNGTVTIPQDGTYKVTAAGGHSSATARIGVGVYRNNASLYVLTSAGSGSGTTAVGLPACEFDFVAGDVIDLRIFANSTGVTAVGGNNSSFLRVERTN